jgi:hypothetical protein
MRHTCTVVKFPDPAELYPDVAAIGSLAAALQVVAAERGLELGQVVAGEKRPITSALIMSAAPGREALAVNAGADERCWVISGWGQGISLVSGTTQDLAEVARAACLWRAGSALREIERCVPFVQLTRLALAAEEGPEHVVSTQWQSLLDQARTADSPEHLQLVEAAYAEPKLRQLYPYTSHRTLRFSTTTGYPFSPDLVSLQARNGKPYLVRKTWMGDALGETATAQEAVALAARFLPGDLGPAVAGRYFAPTVDPSRLSGRCRTR